MYSRALRGNDKDMKNNGWDSFTDLILRNPAVVDQVGVHNDWILSCNLS